MTSHIKVHKIRYQLGLYNLSKIFYSPSHTLDLIDFQFHFTKTLSLSSSLSCSIPSPSHFHLRVDLKHAQQNRAVPTYYTSYPRKAHP